MRPWAGFAALGVAVLLILLTASEASDDGASLERERQWRQVVVSERHRADSIHREYERQVVRANRLEASARASDVRRGRAVASSDSVLALLDSALREPTLHPSDTASSLLATVRTAWLSERESSSAVIAELWATVDAKNQALAQAQTSIQAFRATLAAQDSLVAVLTRRAHPSLWTRTVRTARVLAIGAAIGVLIPR